MKTTKMMPIVAVLAFGMVFGLGGAATAVTMETVTVGNAGNAADTRYVTPGYGAVAYEYDIGKYEVTAGQYAEFLNAVAATDTYALYNASMANTATGTSTGSGITRTGSSGSYSYSVAVGFANKPVNYVCWYDTFRFANWMTSGTTESGSYTITDGGPNSGIVTVPDAAQRATWAAGTTAYWLLTSEDEWYKAAYHDKSAGLAATYFGYPTGSDTAPTAVAPAGQSSSPGSANYNNAAGSTTSIVGAYNAGTPFASDSPYGTFDQGGNVWEWNEAPIGGNRGVRGGSFNGDGTILHAWYRHIGLYPASEDYSVGFRVSEVGGEALPVPEPGSLVLLGLGAVGCALSARRRR